MNQIMKTTKRFLKTRKVAKIYILTYTAYPRNVPNTEKTIPSRASEGLYTYEVIYTLFSA